MSFSNTDTGNKPADPYTNTNKDTSVPAPAKIEALDKFVTGCKFGMMTTRDRASGKLVSRCMAIAAKESGSVDYLFFTNTESHKTDELKSDPHVNVSFLDSSGQWASISGTATIETNRDLIAKYYNPTLKAWMGDLRDGKHDGSKDDPRIGIIRVKMVTATYALTDRTFLGRWMEIAKGMVIGGPANVNKIREITDAEAKSRRASH
ncbi:putative BLI-3 blue-light-inducible Bli-3 protein [Xylaria sp. CBS 124048]|nr:putative BLI-3 blue-light-inducible Bli-3 protein [Xylaria sp. CBS 124048]